MSDKLSKPDFLLLLYAASRKVGNALVSGGEFKSRVESIGLPVDMKGVEGGQATNPIFRAVYYGSQPEKYHAYELMAVVEAAWDFYLSL